jgi:hypothetical protein
MSSLFRSAVILAVGVAALMLQAACARSVSDAGGPDPLLGQAGNDPAPLTACVATECPAPWASCGDGLCTTDTSRDIANCGACGNACPHMKGALHATPLCAGGKCAYACDALSADCNGLAADGCEVSTSDDPKNCGGCGIACKDGDICWKGACGCPNGFTQCGNDCRNLASDDSSCGACDAKCVPPPSTDPAWVCGAGAQPSNTTWGCAESACKLTCKPSFGDCDHDLCSNGCETDERSDPANCGACGHACGANQQCVNGECMCPPGTTRCYDRCVDTNVDPNNCGACGNGCPGASDDTANGGPTCAGGTCGYVCYAGFADCNGRINDGCEVDIGKDPLHCGGCGTRCDTSRGQPCVTGQCLTKPCEGPGLTH